MTSRWLIFPRWAMEKKQTDESTFYNEMMNVMEKLWDNTDDDEDLTNSTVGMDNNKETEYENIFKLMSENCADDYNMEGTNGKKKTSDEFAYTFDEEELQMITEIEENNCGRLC